MMKMGVIVPAFNVERTILKVIEGFQPKTEAAFEQILVIDNSSSDSTARLVEQKMKSSDSVSAKLRLIRHHENYGYGESQKTAFEYFINQNMTHVMIIHGDNQGNSEQIAANFLKTLKENPDADIIFASRFTEQSEIKNYSLLRILGNYFFNFFTFCVTGLKMSDSGTGIICVRTDVLKKIPYKSFSSHWQFHPEMNLLIYDNPTLKRVEIPLDWADSEVQPTLKLFQYALKLTSILVRYGFLRNILRQSPEQIFRNQQPKKEFKLLSKSAEI